MSLGRFHCEVSCLRGAGEIGSILVRVTARRGSLLLRGHLRVPLNHILLHLVAHILERRIVDILDSSDGDEGVALRDPDRPSDLTLFKLKGSPRQLRHDA